MWRLLVFFVLLFTHSITFGQQYLGEKQIDKLFEKGANCTPPSTATYLEMNNVRCFIHTAGNLWQTPGQNTAQYEVPKNSGIMALFTSALWMGGVDVNNQLKLAALRYRNGQDYWTGPLTIGSANITADECAKYDAHYVSTQDEVREFVAWFQAGEADAQNGTTTQEDVFPDYEVPESIKTWPAHGDVSQGQDYYLAPFFDYDQDGNYDYTKGDYPWYDLDKSKACKADRAVSLYGDMNLWWVMNDKGNIHTETGSEPIGMEIRAQAFAFASNDEINNMTFYNYELINRGTQTLFDTYFGFFTDGALGDPFDDFVGCDVNRGLAYYYNGDNLDSDNQGFLGYGENPPAVGVDFFEGPYQDNDGIDNAYGIGPGEALNGIGFGDGIVDNERFGMRRFIYYSNTTNGAMEAQTDPIFAADYYNYLKGFWKDGTRFVYGGNGHPTDPDADVSVECDFMFPGDTDPLGWGTSGAPQPEWTEQTAGNVPNDRRFVQSAGPFVLKPGAVNNITVGVVWARSSSPDPFESVRVLTRADDKAQALFENCFKVLDAPHAPEMSAIELENEVILVLSNPPNSNNFNEEYIEFDPFIVTTDSTADKNYRFQGYQIYQLAGKDVAISEIGDETRARLVAQSDIKDNVSRIINFEFDEEIGASIPVEKVDGENKGIKHSYSIKYDQFAQGDNRLVNFKRYYYVAIAYAYNNYKEYSPTDPNALDGQKKKYIGSRKAPIGEVTPIEVIPHHPTPQSGGTLQQVEYGSGPRIMRLDGFGNGGLEIDLTEMSENEVIANGYVEHPVYEYGAGPIGIKVVDPLNVADGYFECLFRDYTTTNENAADTAKWVIHRYNVQGGVLLDSVTSERSIDNANEQIIPEWGIAVQINQVKYEYGDASGGAESKQCELISASMSYKDSSKRWLAGVEDNDAFYPTNWIRSGTYEPIADQNDPGYECLPNVPDWQNPCNYNDEVNQDNEKNWSNILRGTIAPHRLTGYQSSYMPMAYFNYAGQALARSLASISYLPSVNIVFTADQSKWTRCPVIELGREPQFNVGGAEPGALRKSPSVGKDGKPDNSGTTGMGWFPGYAIDVESGARLYMSFGENSFLSSDNGADMIWNPSDKMVDVNGTPIFGGMHAVHVYSFQNKTINNKNSGYDYPAYIPSEAENLATNVLYQDMLTIESPSGAAQKKKTYSAISWIAYPTLMPTQQLLSTEATIKLRVSKEYKTYSTPANSTGGPNNGRPMYGWSMDDIRTVTASQDQLADALDMINVVPNPYYAYSEYETGRLDNRVKITNLPERCTVRIFTPNGKLIRTYKKDTPMTFLDWDLTNRVGIPVASGVYLIHVEIPGIGERVLKSFIGMRQVDLQNI